MQSFNTELPCVRARACVRACVCVCVCVLAMNRPPQKLRVLVEKSEAIMLHGKS